MRTDEEVALCVQRELLNIPTPALDIKFEVAGGIVMLTGVVANESEWFWAGRAAARVVGEGCVGNYVEVRAPQAADNAVEQSRVA